MHSVAGRGGVVEAFDALDAALDRVLELSVAALTTRERLAVLQRCETVRRRLPAAEHPLINGLAEQAGSAELGGKLAWALADRANITRGEARRRIDEAADLGERHAPTGERLDPVLPATAAAQRDGTAGPGHVTVIRDFWHALPDGVDLELRDNAEAKLASLAAAHRPDELAKLAARLTDCLNPDGNFADTDRARRRGLVLGRQGVDGMTRISGHLDPQTRATLDAVLARWAAPGMCNPADETPCLDATPTQAGIDADSRSAAQRNHDALAAVSRAMLASGDLGQHNGLPAAIVVSTSLADLHAAAGAGTTGGGTRLPITDIIRLATHAHHYLRIFDQAREVALFHTKRIANPGQRIVLHARDRGCSHPGCDVPGYLCEVHHITDWTDCHATNIDNLTFACGPHHRLIGPGGWTTRKTHTGNTQWTPPANQDHGQPRTNTYHHPQQLLHNTDTHTHTEDDGDGDEVP